MKRRRHLNQLSSVKKTFDRTFLYLVLILVVLGLVFIADISTPQALNYFNDKFYFFRQQSSWALIGIIGLFITSNIHYSFWKKISVPFFVITILLLVAVLIPGISLKALGARRWISVGTINFQPSEVVKLALAFYLAKVSDSSKQPLSFFIPLALVCGLIMLQPDLGTTLIIGLIGVVQIFVSGVPILYFIGSILAGVIGVIALIIFSPYRRDRLMTFLSMGSDPLGKEYHIRQILLAIGSLNILPVDLMDRSSWKLIIFLLNQMEWL